jgi:hypothetical protein
MGHDPASDGEVLVHNLAKIMSKSKVVIEEGPEDSSYHLSF